MIIILLIYMGVVFGLDISWHVKKETEGPEKQNEYLDKL